MATPRYLRFGMNLLSASCWFFQIILAVVYGASGLVRMSASANQFASIGIDHGAGIPPIFTHAVGLFEILCAIAIVFPAVLGTMPRMTTLAAAAISAVQIMTLFSVAMYSRSQAIARVDVLLLLISLCVLVARSTWLRDPGGQTATETPRAPSRQKNKRLFRVAQTSLNKSKSP